VLDGKFRLASDFHRRPHASGTCALTCISRPGVRSASLAFGGSIPELADLDDTFTRSRVVTAASSRVRLRLDVVRPRPPVPHRSNRPTRALRTDPCHDRPNRPFRGRPSASLEVSPHPLQHTWVASRASSEGGQPPDVSRSGVHACAFRPRCFAPGPRSAGVRPCGFSLLRRDRRGVARSGGHSGWVVRSSLTCRTVALVRVCTIASRSRVHRSRRRDPRRLPVRRAGGVGVADSSFALPHARGGPVGPSAFHAASISPPKPGHAPTRPLARCSATRCSGLTRPCRTRGPSL
jgi:hypothetical protein